MTFVLWRSLLSWQCFLNSAPRNPPSFLFPSLLLSLLPPLSPLPQVWPHFPPHSITSFRIFDHIFPSSNSSQLLPYLHTHSTLCSLTTTANNNNNKTERATKQNQTEQIWMMIIKKKYPTKQKSKPTSQNKTKFPQTKSHDVHFVLASCSWS